MLCARSVHRSWDTTICSEVSGNFGHFGNFNNDFFDGFGNLVGRVHSVTKPPINLLRVAASAVLPLKIFRAAAKSECAECYKTFRNLLLPSIQRIHAQRITAASAREAWPCRWFKNRRLFPHLRLNRKLKHLWKKRKKLCKKLFRNKTLNRPLFCGMKSGKWRVNNE